MNPLKSTALHIAELAVILAVVWCVSRFFPGLVPNEAMKDVVLVVLAGLAKFARASDAVPIKDYVAGK